MIKKKIFSDKHALQTKFCMEKHVPKAGLIKQDAPQVSFLD